MVQRPLSSNRYLFSIASSSFSWNRGSPEIADDLATLLDRLGSEQAEARLGSADAIGFVSGMAGMMDWTGILLKMNAAKVPFI